MALMASSRTPVRRRQRSTRVTVAVSLLAVAVVAVVSSLPSQSALWIGIASVVALALAVGALRIMWTEVLQSRRENAADRAAAAAAYVELFSVRAAEHAEFTTAMTERLAEAHLARRELEGLVTQHRGRADRAESAVATLEKTLESLRAEQTEDLVAWEAQATKKAAPRATRTPRKALKGA